MNKREMAPTKGPIFKIQVMFYIVQVASVNLDRSIFKYAPSVSVDGALANNTHRL